MEPTPSIQNQLEALAAKHRSYKIGGLFALVSLVLLFLAVLVPAIESDPVMAISVTLTMTCLVPPLLRWHALKTEQRVLQSLAQGQRPYPPQPGAELRGIFLNNV